MGIQAGFGPAKAKREPVEVLEPKPLDKSLDKLLGVRKQRLDRLERERRETREEWKRCREEFRQKKLDWRKAVEDSKEFWVKARKEFLSMTTTSGQYQRAKATYERMKQSAADMRVTCLESLSGCKSARTAFFSARERVLAANRQQEKLTIIRDEIRLLHQQSEM